MTILGGGGGGGMTPAQSARLSSLESGVGALYLPSTGRVTTLEAVGHSYLTDTFVARVGVALGATLTNRSVGGAPLQQALNQNIWGGIPSGGSMELRNLSSDTVKHAVVVMFGINDLARYDRKMPGFGGALETLISNRRIAPGAIKLFSDTDIVYTNWTVGSTSRYTVTAGGNFTWTSPSGYLGGWEAFHFSTQQGQGALLTCEVDAVAAGSLDTSVINPTPTPAYNAFYADAVHRVFVPPGAGHTVKFTATAVTGSVFAAYFNDHGTERHQPPLMVVLKQPLPVDYSIFASGYYHVPTDGDIAALNTQIDTSCAKFDGWVIPVDLDRLFRRAPGLFSSDKLHPGYPAGSNLMGEAVMSALRQAAPAGTLAAVQA